MHSMSPAIETLDEFIRNSSNDASLALQAISRIHLALDPPQLLDALMRATAAIGATASIYSITIPETGTEDSDFSLFACHPALAQRQYCLGPLSSHPWARCARGRSIPVTERQVQQTSTADAEAIDLAERFGFKSCLIIPTPSGAHAGVNRVEMLCLGSIDEAAFEGEQASTVRTLARALAAELHDWVNRHLRKSLQEASGLREPDIELLKFELQGLGSKEIANRTGTTPASVDSRFQRINVRLACSSRKASAQRAAAYGLLEPT